MTELEKLAQAQRGFLPAQDPVQAFPHDSPLAVLDEWGRELPSLLIGGDFRQFVRQLKIPAWPEGKITPENLPLLRLYYVRLGFLASGYINQVPQPPATLLPANVAVPLCRACELLERPPILSYDGYALYNWKRFDATGPIALGNIDTLQDFVHLYDEHWFILVHVEIEALAGEILAAMAKVQRLLAGAQQLKESKAAGQLPPSEVGEKLHQALQSIARPLWKQVAVLRRIPEHMDPTLYYRTFRPYIRFFENVVYEGVNASPINHRGETGAQSSILPALTEFMKVPHQQSILTAHLDDMRQFMPAEHRRVLHEIRAIPDIRPMADKHTYNDVLEAMATFREIHFGWAHQYIQRWVEDPRGTGGTPYVRWLQQLIEETRAHKIV